MLFYTLKHYLLNILKKYEPLHPLDNSVLLLSLVEAIIIMVNLILFTLFIFFDFHD